MSPIPADHNSRVLVWLTPTMEKVHKPCAQEGLGMRPNKLLILWKYLGMHKYNHQAGPDSSLRHVDVAATETSYGGTQMSKMINIQRTLQQANAYSINAIQPRIRFDVFQHHLMAG